MEEDLNVRESSNGANSVIAYGKDGETVSNRRDEHPYREVNLYMGARWNLSAFTVPGSRTSEDEGLGESTPVATQPERR
ncbi:hypothetical protein ABZO31_00160 [Streptomyces sp. HUAS MG47]|uniref:hypothetical protein n=1 Tax=Streptomyces solicamelliae TaxID=3231716 RepID=UPI00387799DE